MDYNAICEKEGYRREDLSKEANTELEAQDYIIEQLENLKNNLDFIDEDLALDEESEPDTIIGKIKQEYALKVLNSAIEWVKMEQKEYQVSLAEAE